MFTVLVINKYNGEPAEGARVFVGFYGFSRALTPTKYTDERGEVHFSHENGEGIVYVNGSNVYDGRISGRVTVYI